MSRASQAVQKAALPRRGVAALYDDPHRKTPYEAHRILGAVRPCWRGCCRAVDGNVAVRQRLIPSRLFQRERQCTRGGSKYKVMTKTA